MKATRPAHLAYDWDNHQSRKRTERIGDHIRYVGPQERWVTEAWRYDHDEAPMLPGWTYRRTCEVALCLVHIERVPPVKPKYPAGVCVYCGAPAGTRDHLYPKPFTGEADRGFVVTVPACGECNSIINDRHAPTVPERRRLAHDGLRRKHAVALSCRKWSEGDLQAMGPRLRQASRAAMRRRAWLEARLAWPDDPRYDERAFGQIGVEVA